MNTKPLFKPDRIGLTMIVSLALLFSACSQTEKTSAPPKSERADSGKALVQFYYDLGPAAVDVSGYPKTQQENYKIFLAVCGVCHSAARPLNSPYTDAAVWERFMRRMHIKMEGRGVVLSGTDEKRILDFVVYDSKVRKILKQEEFQAQQENLKNLFINSNKPPDPNQN